MAIPRTRSGFARLLALSATLALLLPAGQAKAAWREASSAHFVVYGNEDEAILRNFAENLERYHAALGLLTGTPDEIPSPSNRVTIYAVGSTEQVRKLYGENASRYLGGFYQPRAGATFAIVPEISAERVSDWDRSLRTVLHEYAHHFLIGASSYAMPRWTGEGAAEFYSSASFNKDGSVNIGRPNPNRILETRLFQDMPLEILLTNVQGFGDRPKGYDTFYARSWLLYHYLSMTPARQGQLRRYLEAVAAGQSSLDAASATLGDLAALDRELGSYASKRRFTTILIKAAALRTGEVQVRALSAGEAATMPLRIQQRRGIQRDAAPGIADEMRGFAARFPKDPEVLAALAEAEHDAGNEAAAVAAADAALALDPRRINAHVQKSLALMAIAAKSRDAKDVNAARVALTALNHVENDHPLPLILYYRSFIEQGAKPSSVAIRGLERATELAPFDFGLRMMLALQQLRDGKTDEARRSLTPIAYNPHGGRLAEQARSLLDRLGQGTHLPAAETVPTAAEGDAD